ncbi:head GIN domain-containing protein [Sphingomonas hylomeconis]|uniref:Head GIN domain-containing protein n=1 Tax=Sphingomonas hylomeconis TaxID=1395958 RepID=A0ABV7SQ08_9SPHN|nr:head GIN domain-containing protein [Sphingomonas hylomeconis]
MRVLAFLVAAPLLAMPLAACSFDDPESSTPGLPASGSGTTRTFAAADFTAVELSGADDIDVRVGTGFSVRAEGPSDELDKLRIERDGTTLKVGRVRSHGISWGSKNKVTVYVTMPRIAAASLAGSGDLTIDRAEGEAFEGALAGSGNLTIGALGVQSAKFALAGTGDIKAAGLAKELEVEIAGTGDVDAAALKAEGADVSIAGTGSVRAQVNGPAKINMLGSGDVDLGPGARCSTSKLGSGEVRCGN